MSGLRLTREQLQAFVADLEALCVKHRVMVGLDYDTIDHDTDRLIRVEPSSTSAFYGADLKFVAFGAGDPVKGSQAE